MSQRTRRMAKKPRNKEFNKITLTPNDYSTKYNLVMLILGVSITLSYYHLSFLKLYREPGVRYIA